MSTTDDLVALRSAAGGRAYPLGAVPRSPAYPYVVVGYAPNAPLVRTLDGSGDPERRFTVQHFSRTVGTLEDAAAVTFATFDGQQVAGETCWQELATPMFRDPDDGGVLSITHTYRF